MPTKPYLSKLTASVNRKGVLEIDTFKGCPDGIRAHGPSGCYGLCYAANCANFRGKDFATGSSRKISEGEKEPSLFHIPGDGGDKSIFKMVMSHNLSWFRIGVNGDPSHDWEATVEVCEWLGGVKTPIIVTKHWKIIPSYFLPLLREVGTVFNTSISALDTAQEREHRLAQFKRIGDAGIKSVLRVVTCKFGETENGRRLDAIQRDILANRPVIDNPLRIPANDHRVLAGDIIVTKRQDLTRKVSISINDESVYIGHCDACPDQCGIFSK